MFSTIKYEFYCPHLAFKYHSLILTQTVFVPSVEPSDESAIVNCKLLEGNNRVIREQPYSRLPGTAFDYFHLFKYDYDYIKLLMNIT